MKLISMTFIMAYLVAAGFSYELPGVTFWNVIFGFAAMLAVFQLLNLRVSWVSVFGAIAYAVIAVKMTGTAPTEKLFISSGHIAGLVVSSVFCAALAFQGLQKKATHETPDAPAPG
jgi:hypothetical protein